MIGKLVGVDPSELRHESHLRPEQLVLADGMTLGFSRRIQSGNRRITFEATRVPTLVSEMPELVGDPAAAAAANAGR